MARKSWPKTYQRRTPLLERKGRLPVTLADIDLAMRWVRGEITAAQVERELTGKGHHGNRAYSFLSRTLGEYIRKTRAGP